MDVLLVLGECHGNYKVAATVYISPAIISFVGSLLISKSEILK